MENIPAARVNQYPYYGFENRHLPPANGNFFSPFYNDSFTWATLAGEQESEKRAQNSDYAINYGQWNGYFPWVKHEMDSAKVPWPLVYRRGGLSDATAFKIQTNAKNLPDLASTTQQHMAFFDAVQARIRYNNYMPTSK